MDTAILKDIGLTNAEIKIYLALLRLGSTSAGAILKSTKLHNSVLHAAILRLIEKGLISFVKKGQRKVYSAKDPKYILRFIDEKRNKLETLLPQLTVQQKPIEKKEAEVFNGITGWKTMLYDFMEGAKPGDDYLYFSVFTETNSDVYSEAYEFYKKHEKERLDRGLDLKGIAPTETKHHYKGRDMSRVLFVDFPIINGVAICNNRVIFMPWEDEIVSFMITSQQMADNYRKYFYSIWDKYKK